MHRLLYLPRWCDRLIQLARPATFKPRCPSTRVSSAKKHARPWLESLEERLAPAAISDGGTAALGIALQAGESLAIVSNGTSYTFTTNQTFTRQAGADPANQGAAFNGFGTKTLTITSAGFAQYSGGIFITDAGANDFVTFNDSGTNAYSNNFNVALNNAAAGAITFNGTSSFGAFKLQASTTRNVLLNPGAVLASTNGNLTVQANQQTVASSGDFAGVTVNGAMIQSTGSGLVTIQGRGGDTGAAEHGVLVENGASVSGGTGSVVVVGTTGTPANLVNASGSGVYLTGSSATITSGGGNVQVTGLGSPSGTQARSYGVYIGPSGKLMAGGAGSVTVQGSGGTTSGGSDEGIHSEGSITTNNGNLQLTGSGGIGASGHNYGINLLRGQVIAGGAGSVTLKGTGGGAGDVVSNDGIDVNSKVSSIGGDISIIGIGGVGPNAAVLIIGQIKAGGTNSVTVQGTTGIGTGVFVLGGTISTEGGNIRFTGTVNRYSGDGVNIQSGTVIAGGNGSVTLEGRASPMGGGVGVNNSNSTIRSQGGNVIVSGTGGGVFTNGNHGVVTGTISAGGSGVVTIQGTGGLGTASVGVIVSGTVSTSGGDIAVTGQGGQGALQSNQNLSGQNFGVEVNGKIIAGGTGNVAVNGTGGATGFGDSFGVYLTPPIRGDNGSVPTITSSGGNVVVIGQGGGQDDEPTTGRPSGFSSGVYLYVRGVISAGGDGTVTVQGTGGARDGGTNDGVHLVGNTGATVAITSNNGDVLIIGTGGGSPVTGMFDSPNDGIEANNPFISAGGKGNLVIIGIANYGVGAVLPSLSTARGNIRVVTDSIYLGRVTLGSGGSTTLIPYTAGTPINIGSTSLPRAGALVFYAQNLKYLSANNVTFGGFNTGPISVSEPIVFPATTNFNFTSASDIVQTAAIDTHGGNLTLAPGATGAFKPLAGGTDINIGSGTLQFVPGSNLALAINGKTVDTQYDQLNVIGDVNLTGANLVLSGTYTPVVGDTFTLVNNNGMHLIIGTFKGLPEGAIIPYFLGSRLSAVISYSGGDGNDVVLTVKNLPLPVRAGITYKPGYASLTEPAPGKTLPYYFTIALDDVPTKPVTVYYQTRDGSARAGEDYRGVHNYRVTFPAFAHGATATSPPSQDIAITVNGDAADGTDPETFAVVLTAAYNATVNSGEKSATGTIMSATPQAATKVNIADFSAAGRSAGSTVFNVPITLDGQAAQPITVYYSTTDGTAKAGVDYVGQKTPLARRMPSTRFSPSWGRIKASRER